MIAFVSSFPVMKGTVVKKWDCFTKTLPLYPRSLLNDELTQVYKLDETELPRYPLGWEPWLQTALDTIQYQTETEELIFYVGEKAYKGRVGSERV